MHFNVVASLTAILALTSAAPIAQSRQGAAQPVNGVIPLPRIIPRAIGAGKLLAGIGAFNTIGGLGITAVNIADKLSGKAAAPAPPAEAPAPAPAPAPVQAPAAASSPAPVAPVAPAQKA